MKKISDYIPESKQAVKNLYSSFNNILLSTMVNKSASPKTHLLQVLQVSSYSRNFVTGKDDLCDAEINQSFSDTKETRN